ncbi:MAG: pectinesterase family protein [Phycisphaerae bacterium]
MKLTLVAKTYVMAGAAALVMGLGISAAHAQDGASAPAATGPDMAWPKEPTAPAGLHADAVVASDGSGQYKTIRAAVDACPQMTSDPGKRWVILVKPGTYKELVYVQREKRFVRLVGADARNTVLTYDLVAGMPGPDGKAIGTFRTPTLEIDADDFAVENMTIANSAGRKGQALALRVEGDRVAFRHCRFLGYQDTILVDRGRQYFEDCDIQGATDFIFGGSVAWFEKCRIYATAGGYLTAASTPDFQPFGYVFNECEVDGTPGVKTFLGRPWRDYAKVVFLRTKMSDVVRPEGWNDWKKAVAHQTTTYAEFESSGAGGESAKRVEWSKQLTAEEAAKYTVEKVLDGWRPDAGSAATQK